jgi:hypothetical protein
MPLNVVAKWLELLFIIEVLGSNFILEIYPPDRFFSEQVRSMGSSSNMYLGMHGLNLSHDTDCPNKIFLSPSI